MSRYDRYTESALEILRLAGNGAHAAARAECRPQDLADPFLVLATEELRRVATETGREVNREMVR